MKKQRKNEFDEKKVSLWETTGSDVNKQTDNNNRSKESLVKLICDKNYKDDYFCDLLEKKIFVKMSQKNPETVSHLSKNFNISKNKVNDALGILKSLDLIFERNRCEYINWKLIKIVNDIKLNSRITRKPEERGFYRDLKMKGIVKPVRPIKKIKHLTGHKQFSLTEIGNLYYQFLKETIPNIDCVVKKKTNNNLYEVIK